MKTVWQNLWLLRGTSRCFAEPQVASWRLEVANCFEEASVEGHPTRGRPPFTPDL